MRRKRYSVSAVVLAVLLAIAGVTVAGRISVRAQENVTVRVGDIWYCDPADAGGLCVTDIYAGDTVTWDFSSAELPHTVTYCGSSDSCNTPVDSPVFDSGIVSGGGTFSYTFAQPGSYAYFCQVHPQLQMGRVIVHEGARPPTPTLVYASPPVDNMGTPVPTPTALPYTGQGPDGGGGSLFVALVIGGTALVAGGGALALRGRASRR